MRQREAKTPTKRTPPLPAALPEAAAPPTPTERVAQRLHGLLVHESTTTRSTLVAYTEGQRRLGNGRSQVSRLLFELQQLMDDNLISALREWRETYFFRSTIDLGVRDREMTYSAHVFLETLEELQRVRLREGINRMLTR